FCIYRVASDMQRFPVTRQRTITLHLMGPEAISTYYTFDTIAETEDHPTVDEILDKFEQHFGAPASETYQRHLFFTTKQAGGQRFDDFATSLKKIREFCNFEQLNDSITRDAIVLGVRDTELKKRLLRTANLTLEACIDTARAHEKAEDQIVMMINIEL